MSRDDEGLDVGTAAHERLRVIIGGLDDEDFARDDPPLELWGRIASALDEPADGRRLSRGPATATDPIDGPSAGAAVVSLDQRRRQGRRRVLVAVAAAVLVLLGVTGGLLAGRDDGDAGPELVATATLEPLEPIAATAEARLVQAGDQLQLVVEALDMAVPPPGRHYELWLLGGADDEPVDLGPMAGSTAVPVPEGIDLTRFDVVDISLQEQGQAEHSAHSLLRGTLA